MPQFSKVHTFTNHYRNGVTRTLYSQIGVSPVFDPAHPPPGINPHAFQALWDTGATSTMVTKRLADDLGLMPIRMGLVSGVHGSRECPVYMVNVFLPNKFIIAGLPVIGNGEIANADVLVGMDLINYGDFAISKKNGNTLFSFRVPSVAPLDFTIDATLGTAGKVVNTPRAGRNEPCPCGSGKKHKRCCGR